MLLKQAELFWGLSHIFIEKVMAGIVKETQPAGTLLFSKGDAAEYFYTLVKGRVKLRIGENGRMVFVVSQAGESFGWSALVGREAYSASAECVSATTVVKIERERFSAIVDAFPIDGYRFMKRLSRMLGRRLLQSYQTILSLQQSGEATAQGTGQRLEPEPVA